MVKECIAGILTKSVQLILEIGICQFLPSNNYPTISPLYHEGKSSGFFSFSTQINSGIKRWLNN